MPAIERITLRVSADPEDKNSEALTCTLQSACRSETLGGRLKWRFRGSDANARRVASLEKRQVKAVLSFHLTQNQPIKLDCSLKLVGAHPQTGHWDLEFDQTVEAAKHLIQRWQAWNLPGGDYESWLKGMREKVFSPDANAVESLKSLAAMQPAVVIQADQTDVELAAWLAWAASAAARDSGKDLRFWLTGGGQPNWRLVLDSSDKPIASLPASAQVRAIAVLADSSDRPYLQPGIVVTHFEYPQQLQASLLKKRLHQSDLPGRLLYGTTRHWLIARHDTWSTNPVPWNVRLETSDRPPEPAWSPPRPASRRIMGVTTEDWKSGATVNCRIESDSTVVPVRLTTFDAGHADCSGWQWVPSADNRIAIDTDWRLTGLPAIRYVERTKAAAEAHLAQLPESKAWLVKVGRFVGRFIKRGLYLD